MNNIKEFIKDNLFLITVALVITFVISFFAYDYSISEYKMMSATVIEHNVTADRYGDRTYTTIVKTDDGFIEEKKGLSIYSIPVGCRCQVEVKRYKK